MSATSSEGSLAAIEADAVVIGVHSNADLEGHAAQFNELADGLLTRLLEQQEIKGKLAELTTIFSPPGLACSKLIVAGLGDKSELSDDRALKAAAAATRSLTDQQRARVVFAMNDVLSDRLLTAAICGSHIGGEGQGLYQESPGMFVPERIDWYGVSEDQRHRGESLAAAINLTRQLVNEPPNKLYPESFADAAEEIANSRSIAVEVWNQEKLEQEGCGSLLAVAQGSAKEPRLVILRYQGGGSEDPPLALVGKGVTFDSGGLSLKPSDSMKTMKCDMAGAATVLGTVQAISDLDVPLNVIGILGLVENMPSANAFRLGDVLEAKNGRTIEVHNTDAEGRLVLADALSVAVELGATRLIDLATLTGACCVALGLDVVGIMTNDQGFCDQLQNAAAATDEKVWQLPMFAEFRDQLKSDIADVKNVGQRWGGAITAAKFLEEFVSDTPWVHMDIAGPAFLETTKPWMDGGGTGVMIRTLVELAERLASAHD